jgi:hypothetical protein
MSGPEGPKNVFDIKTGQPIGKTPDEPLAPGFTDKELSSSIAGFLNRKNPLKSPMINIEINEDDVSVSVPESLAGVIDTDSAARKLKETMGRARAILAREEFRIIKGGLLPEDKVIDEPTDP